MDERTNLLVAKLQGIDNRNSASKSGSSDGPLPRTLQKIRRDRSWPIQDAGFYFVQRMGMFRIFGAILSHCAGDERWRNLAGKSGEPDRTLREIYSRVGAVAASCIVTMVSFVTGSVEVWIGLHAIGVRASFEHALILECVGQGSLVWDSEVAKNKTNPKGVR